MSRIDAPALELELKCPENNIVKRRVACRGHVRGKVLAPRFEEDADHAFDLAGLSLAQDHGSGLRTIKASALERLATREQKAPLFVSKKRGVDSGDVLLSHTL